MSMASSAGLTRGTLSALFRQIFEITIAILARCLSPSRVTAAWPTAPLPLTLALCVRS